MSCCTRRTGLPSTTVLVVALLLVSAVGPEAALSFLVLRSLFAPPQKLRDAYSFHQGSALGSRQPGPRLEEMRISRYGDVIPEQTTWGRAASAQSCQTRSLMRIYSSTRRLAAEMASSLQ